MGALKIVYYLERYHDIEVSESTVYRNLKAHGMSRMTRRTVKRIRRFQYMAIDEATRIRNDRGHEFQVKLQRCVEDTGMEHV